jgi:hypothetical protein
MRKTGFHIPAKYQRHDEKQIHDRARDFGQIDCGNHQVPKGPGKHHELDDEEQHQSSSLMRRSGGASVLIQPDRIIPDDKEGDGGDQIEDALDQDVGGKEDGPSVSLARTFANLVKRPLRDEFGEDLFDDLAKD